MKRKQLLAFFLCLSLATPGALVSAEEPVKGSQKQIEESAEEEKSTETDISKNPEMEKELELPEAEEQPEAPAGGLGTFDMLGTNMDAVFAEMESALGTKDRFVLSESIGENSETSISQEPLFDMSSMNFMTDTALDMGTTNLKYEAMSEGLLESYGSIDLSGKSGNSMELFQNTYGDLAKQLTLEEPKIPEGFDVGTMLNNASQNINSMYNSASNSGSFATVKGSLSIGNIFSVANQGVSAPSMKSLESLADMITPMGNKQNDLVHNMFQNKKENIMERSDIHDEDLKSSVTENFLNMVDMDNSMLSMNGNINQENIEDVTKDTKDVYEESDVHQEKWLIYDPIGIVKTIGSGIWGTVKKGAGKIADFFTGK